MQPTVYLSLVRPWPDLSFSPLPVSHATATFTMDYKQGAPRIQPRLIIHGGAGNISPVTITPEKRVVFRAALTEIVTRTSVLLDSKTSALEIATYAVSLLEDNPLFNSGYGAVFTRDGINELEASVMVSRGRAKRGVGVMGLKRVRNPILLARRMLEEGDYDLAPRSAATAGVNIDRGAQGHTQVHGATAEALAASYGLPLVEPSYFFTQNRWDEHVRGLQREADHTMGTSKYSSASWSADEYLPQGTVGAVALDADGVVCCATSTGGLTNKLTGRIGDTPVVGAGSWAEAWTEEGDPTSVLRQTQPLPNVRPAVELSRALCSLLADCLPIPRAFSYAPIPAVTSTALSLTTTRSVAVSGTGNGDSFLRVGAAHAVAAMAQYKPVSSAAALSAVTGPGGILQQSAEDRFGLTGEGEGGIIGIESVVVRDKESGAVHEVRGTIIADCNCGGMFRGWIDDAGRVQVRIFRDDTE
ncbi:l-asparaginase precursor [Ophiostoma piceae UAMH 11346]|uniref:L-asparaginase n=1 Tax=Ophiostoma piceae (strain UAMH 11346) TaxID=1262450 RepID=S3D3R3_OPHP1|nr:l-asparaginase precursor [Ophiostoma piceae UAMH 11346]